MRVYAYFGVFADRPGYIERALAGPEYRSGASPVEDAPLILNVEPRRLVSGLGRNAHGYQWHHKKVTGVDQVAPNRHSTFNVAHPTVPGGLIDHPGVIANVARPIGLMPRLVRMRCDIACSGSTMAGTLSVRLVSAQARHTAAASVAYPWPQCARARWNPNSNSGRPGTAVTDQNARIRQSYSPFGHTAAIAG